MDYDGKITQLESEKSSLEGQLTEIKNEKLQSGNALKSIAG
jgi:hypothetical protein